MFERTRNGWRLAAQIRKIIMSDKKLFVYPLLIAIVTLIEFVLIFASVTLIPAGGNINLAISNLNASSSANSFAGQPAGASAGTSSSVSSQTLSQGYTTDGYLILGLFVFYLISTFSTMYLVIALLISFRSYVNDKDRITFRSALKAVRPYLRQILEWAVFYAIVLLVLRLLEARFRGLGRLIVAGIGSFTLALASFFAAQVILDKKTGPIATVKASFDTIIHHFGATFGGVAYSDLYGLMFAVMGILLIVAGGVAFMATGIILLLIIAAVGFALMVFGLLISFTTLSVFKLILYDYASTGTLPQGFDKNMVDMTIKQRKTRNNQL